VLLLATFAFVSGIGVGLRFPVFALIPTLLVGCGGTGFAASAETSGTIAGAVVLFAIMHQLGYLSGALARRRLGSLRLRDTERRARARATAH
jgi:hypothetical protein